MCWRTWIGGLSAVAAASCVGVGPASAGSVAVLGGQTSVLLDTATLAGAASLNLSGVSDDVIVPGELGSGSVAFGINSRTDTPATTFAYDPADFLGTFSGAIEHTGSVFFNDDAVEVGDFTIGFDAARAGGDASGFFVESTTGIAAVLFDIAAPSLLEAGTESLVIEADLLVSAEFGAFLFDNGLSASNLTGADVGDARVSASTIPSPSAVAGGLVGLALLASRRRRAEIAGIAEG
ncbi:MAG: hypothetical protein AAF710_01690 [Planctomycetota bacterium]